MLIALDFVDQHFGKAPVRHSRLCRQCAYSSRSNSSIVSKVQDREGVPVLPMGSPQSRRKRRRTFRAQSTFRKQTIARMVPFLAVMGGVVMIVIMCIRQALRPGGNRSRPGRSHARETMPLAILLQEQHEINSQVQYAKGDACCQIFIATLCRPGDLFP